MSKINDLLINHQYIVQITCHCPLLHLFSYLYACFLNRANIYVLQYQIIMHKQYIIFRLSYICITLWIMFLRISNLQLQLVMCRPVGLCHTSSVEATFVFTRKCYKSSSCNNYVAITSIDLYHSVWLGRYPRDSDPIGSFIRQRSFDQSNGS